MDFVNTAQFLSATLALPSATVAVMSPVTRIYASEESQRFDDLI